MMTLYYLFYCLLAVAGALAIGLATHYWHAHLQPYPDKLFDGDGLGDTVLNELISPRYTMFGKYDEDGYWDFDSRRNYAIHAAPFVILVGIGIALTWHDQAGAVAWVCDGLHYVGIKPLAC